MMSRNDNDNKKKRLVALTRAAAAITSLVASIAVIGAVPSVTAQQFQDQDLDQRPANDLALNEEIGMTMESTPRPADDGLPPEENRQCPVGFTLNQGICETESVITCADPFEVSENRCIMYEHEDTTAAGCLGGSLETGQGGETACADLDEEPIKYRAKFCPQGYRFFDGVCTRFYTADEAPQLVCPEGSTLKTETKTCQTIRLS
jgi:hypothetical protein